MGITFSKPKSQWTEEELEAYSSFIELTAEYLAALIEENPDNATETQSS